MDFIIGGLAVGIIALSISIFRDYNRKRKNRRKDFY